MRWPTPFLLVLAANPATAFTARPASFLARPPVRVVPSLPAAGRRQLRGNGVSPTMAVAEAGALWGGFKWIAAAPTLYALMSWNEYITHRYYQHAEFNKTAWMQKLWMFFTRSKQGKKIRGGGHVEHHAETLDDMSLKTDATWRRSQAAKSLDNDKYRGTAFTWLVAGLMTIQMLPTTIPIFSILGFSLRQTFAILLPGMALHTLAWNALHPNMHGLPDIPLAEGPPARWMARFRNTAYFKWLYQNHQGHHVVGGKGNYNVCCPLVDHLLGTYIKESDWRPMMRPVKVPVNNPDRELSISSA